MEVLFFSLGAPAPADMVAEPDTAMAPGVTSLGTGHRQRSAHSGDSPRNRRRMLDRSVWSSVIHLALRRACRPSVERCAWTVDRDAAVSGDAPARVDGECLARPSPRPRVVGIVDLEHRREGRALADNAVTASVVGAGVGAPPWPWPRLTLPSLLVSAAVGHSAAIEPLWAVPLKAIHLGALAVWFGGLLWIVVRERSDASTTATDVARVSTLALWAVIAVTASGIAQTLILVQSTAGVRSPYAGVVIAKIIGLVLLVGFGAYHRRRFVPAIATRGEQRGARVETMKIESDPN